jgi:hypothetical protein
MLETSKTDHPIVNLDKATLAEQVYIEDLLWYIDNILSFRDNDMNLVDWLADSVDMVDPKISEVKVSSSFNLNTQAQTSLNTNMLTFIF